jgi:O-succinylbenzoic acid--CoA ligase
MEPWVLRAAATHPSRAALVTDSGALSYGSLADRARDGAAALAARGVRGGDRVAIALPAGEAFAIALHACLVLGAPAVPIDLRLARAERAARAGGAAAVVDSALAPEGVPSVGAAVPGASSPAAARGAAWVGAAAAPGLDATAVVMHTSGTTAAARPVELTYGNLLWSALASAVALGLDPDERWLCPMPLAHVGGLSILVRSAVYGTTAVVHERFEVGAVLRALRGEAEGVRITLVSLVPTMLARLLEAGLRSPPALRWALLGGGPIAPGLLERAASAGVPVLSTYGMTEACSQIVTGGRPLPGVSVRLAADGEILVQGPTVAAGALERDGWLHTGDLGTWDVDGRLTIVGRKADTIVSGGENVAPAEVEAVLLEHPLIADAGVFGRPDPEWGEAVVARVVPRNGARLGSGELQSWCRRRLAPFKVPKVFEWADSLPRTASGKLLRRELG